MNRHLTLGAVALGVAVVLAGCGSGVDNASQPSTSTPASTSTAAIPPTHLLYISDSSGWRTGEAYAALAQERLEAPVELVDWRRPGLSMVDVPKYLRRLPKVVADAEIVVLWANPLGSGAKEKGNTPCVDEESDEAPAEFSEADWKPFADLTGEVLDAIWEARGGQPTVLRVTDLYSPVVASWKERGIRDVCMSNFEAMSAALQSAAEAHGATFVSSLDVYNGSDHLQDPVVAGLISEDGVHPAEAGGQAMAVALAAAGFDPAPAP